MSEIINLLKLVKNRKKMVLELKEEKLKFDTKKKKKSESITSFNELYTVKLINSMGKEYFINFNNFDAALEVYKLIYNGNVSKIILEKNRENIYRENTFMISNDICDMRESHHDNEINNSTKTMMAGYEASKTTPVSVSSSVRKEVLE